MGNEKSNGLSILCIEDDLTVQTLLGFYFKKWPHHLEYASDGNSALKTLEENNYDLILMDWSLPKPPYGQQLIDSIKKISGYEDTPIIVVTGYDKSQDLKDLKEDTIYGFLNKPINKRNLKKMINELE